MMFKLQLITFLAVIATVASFPGMRMGNGMGGMGMGPSGDDMQTIQNLMQNHNKIHRNYSQLSNGIHAVTESDDPQVTAWIQQHVAEMKRRVEEDNPIRECDPLFAAVFEHTKELSLKVTNTTKGVEVVETGTTQCATELVQAHAAVVSKFVKNGMQEAMRCNPHPAPKCSQP